ncbi:MAG: hypothetical protein KatS3mg111_1002 [Pirellulaceae bacterium]|nr:MAG: hypothetical protein KatS3mg111_1002 [Pirellulaceae bacterium]
MIAAEQSQSTWEESLGRQLAGVATLAVGVVNGSSQPISGTAWQAASAAMMRAVANTDRLARLLTVRIDGLREPGPAVLRRPSSTPHPKRSPLGDWYETVIHPATPSVASIRCEFVTLLASLRRQFQFLLVDAGPVDRASAIAPYLDACYLILGPQACASTRWLRAQVDALRAHGVHLEGTLIAEFEAVDAT